MKKHFLLALLVGCAWGIVAVAEDVDTENVSLDIQTEPDATVEEVTVTDEVSTKIAPSQDSEEIAAPLDATEDQADVTAPAQESTTSPTMEDAAPVIEDTDELPTLLETEADTE